MELQETARKIAHLQGLLDEMREKYADQEDLYEIYSQSIREDVRTLTRHLRAEATRTEGEVGLWVSVQSESFGSGRVPLAVVTQLLNAFSLCVKYAASIVKGDGNTSGSFTQDTTEAGSFDLVAIEAGSTRFGLRHSVSAFQDFEPGEMEDILTRVRRNRELSQRAVRTLVLGLQASVDDAALDDLVSFASEPAARVLLDRVERLFPKGVTQLGIDALEADVSGQFLAKRVLAGRSRRLDELSSLQKVKDPDVGARRPYHRVAEEGIRRVAEMDAAYENPVDGTGRLVMLDVERARVRLVNVRFGQREEVISTMTGYAEDDVSGLTNLLGAKVAFQGILKVEYDETPNVIRIQEMTAAESE